MTYSLVKVFKSLKDCFEPRFFFSSVSASLCTVLHHKGNPIMNITMLTKCRKVLQGASTVGIHLCHVVLFLLFLVLSFTIDNLF